VSVRLSPDEVDLIIRTHGRADPACARRFEIPGDAEFPALVLPADSVMFTGARAYPISFETDGVHLFVQVASFDLKEGPGGWAIPTAYEPKDDAQRVRKLLGFDEGWENAAHECLLVCDAAWHPFWMDVLARRRFGLTVVGAQSLYPNKIGDREAAPLTAFLAR
jgi:hypothetical protein